MLESWDGEEMAIVVVVVVVAQVLPNITKSCNRWRLWRAVWCQTSLSSLVVRSCHHLAKPTLLICVRMVSNRFLLSQSSYSTYSIRWSALCLSRTELLRSPQSPWMLVFKATFSSCSPYSLLHLVIAICIALFPIQYFFCQPPRLRN